ncbi:uncharacterized protein LOC141673437 [Apium graveolens]|uniref:uncharacterized protein LOC141673437 n=1 Tax=Apium graveolens TaxID=4045 RepID=UPI003D7A1DA2
MEAPELSCIDLIVDPCFPIRLVACDEGTNNLIEQYATEVAPGNFASSSLSGSPLTRLTILSTASLQATPPLQVPLYPISKPKYQQNKAIYLQLHVKNQFASSIKVMRTDNGTEFLNKLLASIYNALGIIHQTSCVYTPQQNSLVERQHRHILNTARALQYHAGLHIHFWGDCILTAVYLINRTPTPVLKGKTPYEVLFNKPPDFDYQRVFGSLYYASTLPATRDKFETCASNCVFLGYLYAKKGYRVFDLHTRRVFVSRHVKFVEHILPFLDIHSTTLPPLFTESSSSLYDPLAPATEDPSPPADSFESARSSPVHVEIPAVTPSPPPPPPPPHLPVTRYVRVKHLPHKFADYTGLPTHLTNIVNADLYPLDHYVQYEYLKPSYQTLIVNIIKIPEPKFYKQAVTQTE